MTRRPITGPVVRPWDDEDDRWADLDEQPDDDTGCLEPFDSAITARMKATTMAAVHKIACPNSPVCDIGEEPVDVDPWGKYAPTCYTHGRTVR